MTALTLAVIGIAGTVLGALVNGALATRAKVNEEMRQLRLTSYPVLWQLTSNFSRWPKVTHTYGDLVEFHGWFRSWYYEVGGLHLSENSRARYGEVQELTAACLDAGAQAGSAIPDDVYDELLEACSALRTALTEDLESRRQRSFIHRVRLAAIHRQQKRKAANRLADAQRRAEAATRAQPTTGGSVSAP